MKAMIFAAGLGTRLAPLTDKCPKALIEVGGRPMLRRAIERLRDAGIDEIVVNVHHHAEMIKDYLSVNNFGVKVLVSDESDCLLDTGGGVVKAASLLGDADDVMLYNADIFTDFSIGEMVEAHRHSGADVTLLTDDRKTSRYLLFDKDGLMRGWKNVSTGEIKTPFSAAITGHCALKAFGGIHIIKPHVITMMKEWGESPKFSITSFYIASCDRLAIKSFRPSAPYVWIDIGRPETLRQARELADSK